jgi:hypothetical protein
MQLATLLMKLLPQTVQNYSRNDFELTKISLLSIVLLNCDKHYIIDCNNSLFYHQISTQNVKY